MDGPKENLKRSSCADVSRQRHGLIHNQYWLVIYIFLKGPMEQLYKNAEKK